MNALQWARAQWDRVLAVVLFALGGVAILLGWAGVRQEALTAAQVPYLVSGGLGGLSLIGVGAVFWLSADLRDEWRKLDDLDGEAEGSGVDAEHPRVSELDRRESARSVRPIRSAPVRARAR